MGRACSMYGGEDTTQHGMASCYSTKELFQNNVLGCQRTAEHFKKPSPSKHTVALISVILLQVYSLLTIHHHHHVHEGLGVFPVP